MLHRLARAVRCRFGSGSHETEERLDQLQGDLRDLERALRELKQDLVRLRRRTGLEAQGEQGSFAEAAQAAAGAGASEPGASVGAGSEPDAEGPDNASARARAEGRTLVIDEDECIGCGTCVEFSEEAFEMLDNGKAAVVDQDASAEAIQEALEACPVTCIRWA